MFENIPVGENVDTPTELSAINETADAFVRRCSQFDELISQKRDALVQSRASDFERAGLVSTENGVRTVDKDRQPIDLSKAVDESIVADALKALG